MRSEELALRQLRPVAERQPGEREPAPGLLALVQAFANTFWDLEGGRPEQLTSPSALARWLSGHALLEPGTRLRRADLRRALDVREGLRSMLFFNNGAEEDREAVQRLNRALWGPRPVCGAGILEASRLQSAAPGPRRRARLDRDDRRTRTGGRPMGPPEGLPRRGLRLDLLRPQPQPGEHVVRDVRVRVAR